ncbi:MAG: PQQ-binding-like beta-propeller repeat protein [Myxococcota bacterium]
MARWADRVHSAQIVLGAIAALVMLSGSAQAQRLLDVVDLDGEIVRVLDELGDPIGERRPIEGEGESLNSVSPRGTLEIGVERELYDSSDPETGRLVSSEGVISGGNDSGAGGTTGGGLTSAAHASGNPTIDSFTLTENRYDSTYLAGANLAVLGRAETYTLNNGATWRSGAGSASYGQALFDRVEVDGNTVRYYLRFAGDPLLLRHTDYNGGQHSSNGTLHAAGEIYLEAVLGSTTAVLRGGAEIISNEPANYTDDRFYHWSAIAGAIVPFEQTYTHSSGTWQTDTFDSTFRYRTSGGVVDFTNPLYEPSITQLDIRGASRAVVNSTIFISAVATYENGATFDFSDDVIWSVMPTGIATVDEGELVIGEIAEDRVDLEVFAAYVTDDGILMGSRTITVLGAGELGSDPGSWPTYQGNRGHTGYVPIGLDPQDFSVRWERNVGLSGALHQVAAGDGRVFVSGSSRFQDGNHLTALDARDGETLWAESFGRASSVNPPAYAYGTVYIQLGKGTDRNANPSALIALDGQTGERIFTAPFGAQWESYLAPTVYAGHAYINAGTYGGMYSFNAFSGELDWFHGLPQYDDWTPAVDEQYSYAYVGNNSPALYVVDRISGERVFQIPDANFSWNGWSMNLAPVLGGREDVLAIHDGRLIRFDLAGRRIAWERDALFVGQPSVRDGVVYAVAGGDFVATDQDSGAELWRWSAPGSASLIGELLVTDTHAFVRSEAMTYAIELAGRQSDWIFPRSGRMAIAEETLYLAQPNGVVTAISMPEYTPANVVEFEPVGPDTAVENAATQFTARVTYDDGRIRDRTSLATWTIDPPSAGTIEDGELVLGELFDLSATIIVTARFEENGSVWEQSFPVTIQTAVGAKAFVERNLDRARALREGLEAALAEANLREQAARRVLLQVKTGAVDGPPDPQTAHDAAAVMGRAISKANIVETANDFVVEQLEETLSIVDRPARNVDASTFETEPEAVDAEEEGWGFGFEGLNWSNLLFGAPE